MIVPANAEAITCWPGAMNVWQEKGVRALTIRFHQAFTKRELKKCKNLGTLRNFCTWIMDALL